MSIGKFLGVILTLAASTAWANNWYIGTGVGPEIANFEQRSTVRQPGSFNVKNETSLAGTGLFGSIFVGYAGYDHSYYLASELNATFSTLQSTSSNKEFIHNNFSHTAYKIRQSFGISMLPGYLVAPHSLLYGRLGYTNGRFTLSTSDASLKKIGRNLSGIRYGLGINQLIYPMLSVIIDYSRIQYQQTKFTVVDTITTKTTKITPTTNQIELGLIYYFF